MTAENGGDSPLIAKRIALGPWERFICIELGNNKVAIQSKNNGQYVCAGNGGAQPLIANRGAIGPW